jgi:hypothetical protein
LLRKGAQFTCSLYVQLGEMLRLPAILRASTRTYVV